MDRTPNPIDTVMSTEEFLTLERVDAVTAFVSKLMDDGKASRRRGWAMSEILAEVHTQLGKEAVPIAKAHFLKFVSEM